ncbi:MAG: circularly permuted type 2 ATP-grasp protein [Glaciecola sp.]|jgi:uncharacterized circularly permuted ATP-grasp superfamily protein/uncharacterized alpha-E superfamily protein|nr:circularly permuted type 2 ATP-grasp protein [Glaciecola sp.]MDG2099532.1 circularly permuted type 2 ATP-grasp protein [Glaciecola sp.]
MKPIDTTLALNANEFSRLAQVDIAYRVAQMQRLAKRDNSVSHDSESNWQLDPLPYIIATEHWQDIERAVIQRAQMMQHVLIDNLSGRFFLQQGLIASSDVLGDPLYLQECQQATMQQDTPSMIAFDIAMYVDGSMQVTKQHLQAPKGLGVLLQNRIVTRRVMGDLFSEINVTRVLHFIEKLQSVISSVHPTLDDPRIVMLAQPKDDKYYSEQAYLAMYLGYTLVRCDDLTVRQGKVWIKTLEGLQAVDVIIRWLEDGQLDPLEQTQSQMSGVAGLLDVIRHDNVYIINPVHISIVNIPAVTKQLVQLTEAIIQAPSLFMDDSLTPTSEQLSAAFWHNGQWQTQPVWIRCFALMNGLDVSVMPSAMIWAKDTQNDAMLVKDAWIKASDVDIFSSMPLRQPSQVQDAALIEGVISSRTAENLFWLGTYIERCETSIRLLRTYIDKYSQLPMYPDLQNQTAILALQQAIEQQACIYPFTPMQHIELSYQPLLAHKQTVIKHIKTKEIAGSLYAALNGIDFAAFQVQELLVSDSIRTIEMLRHDLQHLKDVEPNMPNHMIHVHLDDVMSHILMLSGGLHDTMSHTNGAFMLDFGRRLARSEQLVSLLDSLLHVALDDSEQSHLLDILLISQVSSVTHKRRYRMYQSVQTALELLLLDTQYPRSLAFQIDKMIKLVQVLPQQSNSGFLSEFDQQLLAMRSTCHAQDKYQLAGIEDGQRKHLHDFCLTIKAQCTALRETIQTQYFTHTQLAHSVERQSYTSVRYNHEI